MYCTLHGSKLSLIYTQLQSLKVVTVNLPIPHVKWISIGRVWAKYISLQRGIILFLKQQQRSLIYWNYPLYIIIMGWLYYLCIQVTVHMLSQVSCPNIDTLCIHDTGVYIGRSVWCLDHFSFLLSFTTNVLLFCLYIVYACLETV